MKPRIHLSVIDMHDIQNKLCAQFIICIPEKYEIILLPQVLHNDKLYNITTPHIYYLQICWVLLKIFKQKFETVNVSALARFLTLPHLSRQIHYTDTRTVHTNNFHTPRVHIKHTKGVHKLEVYKIRINTLKRSLWKTRCLRCHALGIHGAFSKQEVGCERRRKDLPAVVLLLICA